MSDPHAQAPDAGDVVWIDLEPQAGREQAGRRPALTLSPAAYNARVGLALFCPITRQVKGYPFEVTLPAGLGVEGVVLADQVRSLDWRVRRAVVAAHVADQTLAEVTRLLQRLLPEAGDDS